MFTENFPGFNFVETPKNKPSDIDGFIYREDDPIIEYGSGCLISGVEVKCRNMTAAELREKYENRWLITADKVDRGISLCRGLGIDFRGFLYLVPEKLLYIVPLWHYDGTPAADIILDRTLTQATVNGGMAMRLNAYVDVGKAVVIAEI